MKKVLVTGAAGFIGRHALPLLLEKGFEVHALSRGRQVTTDSVKWHEANLLDEGAAAQIIKNVNPTHLLHLAWNTKPGLYWTDVDNFQWVSSSLELLHTFANRGGQRVVMAGTCAEYDWRYGWCSEDVTPLSPSTVYGTCKHSMQVMLTAYSKQYGLSSAWGRVFYLYGPHEHPSRLVSSVIRSLLLGDAALCSTGAQVRDFMHVADVASAFVTLLDSEVQGPINIASGEAVAIRDIIEKIASAIGRPELVKLGIRAVGPQDPPLLLADIRRLKNELSWVSAIKLSQGLEDTINWWQSHILRTSA